MIFHSPTGALLSQKLVIPKLAVHKDWHVGLAADPLDHAHPDVGDSDAAGAAGEARRQQEAAQQQPQRRRRLMQFEPGIGGGIADGDLGEGRLERHDGDDARAAAADAQRAAEAQATSDVAGEEAFEHFREDDETWGDAAAAFPSDVTAEGVEEDDGAEFDPMRAAAGGGGDGIRPPREYAHEGAYDAAAAAASRAWRSTMLATTATRRCTAAMPRRRSALRACSRLQTTRTPATMRAGGRRSGSRPTATPFGRAQRTRP